MIKELLNLFWQVHIENIANAYIFLPPDIKTNKKY